MYQVKIETAAVETGSWLYALATVPVAVGILVLFGWANGLIVLTSLRPGLTPMNPMTAVALIASGMSIIFHLRQRSRLAWALAVIPIVLGAGKLLEIVLGWPATDNLLFSSRMGPDVLGAGRMAPNTAAAFTLLGVASLLVARGRRFSVASQLLALSVALIALFAVVGYMFGVAPLHTVAALKPMALHTGTGLFVSAICLAGIQRHGVMAILRDRGPAGALARSVLPVAIVISIAVGGARLWGQQAGLYGTEVGISIQVMGNVILTCALLGVAILMIHRSDKVRIEREAALKRSQQFAQVGHVRWNQSDPQPTWSEEVFRIHGIELGSQPPSVSYWPELIEPDERESFRHYLRSARLPWVDREWRGRIVRPDGEIRHVRVHLATDIVGDQEDHYIFGIVSDVTDLEHARRQAEAATRAKAAFLASMSHELRTPLTGVLGFSELLIRAELDPEHHEQALMVHDSAESLLHLLNDILDFSKIEAGALEIDPQPTNLNELLRQCLSLVGPTARSKGVATFLHVHEEMPDFVEIDGMRLRQIALNLLGNAVKFTQNGFVALEACRSGNDGEPRLLISVQDTGVGIAPDRQQAIFEDFVQADRHVGGRFGGTGLGLSISRRLAELLGGSLTLESEPGRGTRVELNLPLVPLSKPRASPAAAGTTMGERAARVLLVEDMEVNQKLAIAMLGKLGHEVEISGDGLAAVRKMQSFERGEIAFDLVFMDIQLPEIDGLEATRRIRRLGPRGKGIPIIGLSANAYATDVTACLDAGMNDHLGKPFSMESLSRSIARWCKPSSKETRSPVDPEILASLEPMFLEQCAAAADLVVRLSTALGQGATDDVREVSQTLRQACHNLSGTAQTFGRADLGRVAAMAENCLKLFPDRGDWAALSEAIDDLNLQLAATSEQLTQLKAQRSGVA